jgi:hypothetical protein
VNAPTILLVGCLSFAAVAGLALPAPAAAQEAGSLDEELLRGLGGEPIDEIDRELFGRDREPFAPDAVIDRSERFREQLERELGAAAEKEDDNPLLDIARRMRGVQERIEREDSGEETQQLQSRIVADLDALIEQARKSARQSASAAGQQMTTRTPTGSSRPTPGGQQPSQRPAAESELRTEKDEEPVEGLRPDELGDLIKELWGELPQHAREQMHHAPVEDFLPKYRELIEEYFRRLSER